jgi:predicted adenine nucleotide alpha hydrolase (AANH) superfamily ATPase
MLLVHACCADCCLNLLHTLKQANTQQTEIDFYFDNPNIHPESEWHARRQALQKTLKSHPGKLIIQSWQPKTFFHQLQTVGSNHLDSSKRCPRCWHLRLENTARFALAHNYDTITSTLMMSHYQDQQAIQKIATAIGNKYQLKLYIPKQCPPLKTKGFYKQNYCGCVYSLKERLEEKFSISKK